ncbi:TetR/AcrR family transcriptional regulator [Levilactobacillus tangyuanensis]|uniref:TetR/AcrR family transcriptional regulator n=1 Tax=Levilactobacillus tangyuanensis TaxID=2486021 RepID=A0ABW1TQG3_9LACO|nr:TetR/AcrR family transcriptional regulator [Levilactobacillus tangyuanensis]
MATNQERKRRQRLGIMTAAQTLFVRDGFKATHIATVAAEANVSQVTLYKYFDSKLDLGRAVVVKMIADGYRDFQRMVDDSEQSFPDLIRLMMRTKVSLSDHMSGDFYQFVIDEMGGKTGNHLVKDAYEAGKRDFWDDFVARGRAAGMINPDISNEALLHFLSMYVDYFSTANIPSGEYQTIVDQLMHLFFYGFIGAPHAPYQSTEEDDK